jgi:hypothetical protein
MKANLLSFLAALLFASSAFAATATWEYDPALDRGQHQGFRIYYGTISNDTATDPTGENDPNNPLPYQNVIEVADPDARSHEVPLGPGTWYFRLTVYGTADGAPMDSPFSTPEVDITIVETLPGFLAPTNFSLNP